MKYSNRIIKITVTLSLLLLLIFKSKIAVTGAIEGLSLCTRVIIPSLFPFFVVTSYLNQLLIGTSVPIIHRLCHILSIPKGGDSLLLLGLIGGYPVGAQLIRDAYSNEQISSRSGHILLGYCSNAGPAFIFGVAAAQFSSLRISFFLWGIHILSALSVGILLPKPSSETVILSRNPDISLADTIHKSINTCFTVCAWIILFKILLAFLSNCITVQHMTYLSGILELSNGCVQLCSIHSEADRFVLCSAILSFGGICVMLQTNAVTRPLGMGLYIPGKLMQTVISALVSVYLAPFIFPNCHYEFPQLLKYSLIGFPTLLLSKKYAEKRYGNPKANRV